ncbi:MAG TPA: PASTA domain-containing protein, partial [Acidimicrobiales bacterium]
PPLVGLDRTQVAGEIAGFDWVVEYEELRRDGTQPGEVLATSPEAGEKLREGGTLKLVVSAGATLVPVPTDLVGLTEEDARARLEAAELAAGVVRDRSDEFDEGVVMGLDGEVPAELPKGTTVTLVVSMGPEAAEMPDLEGFTRDDAVAALEGLDLDLDIQVHEEPAGRRDRDRVLRTEPGPGGEIDQGQTVVVVVGGDRDGDRRTVPFVIGEDYDDAHDAIKDAGLDVGNVVGSKDDGVVIATAPFPGSEVDKDTKVDIVMSPG